VSGAILNVNIGVRKGFFFFFFFGETRFVSNTTFGMTLDRRTERAMLNLGMVIFSEEGSARDSGLIFTV
jgi:hypothetical protein